MKKEIFKKEVKTKEILLKENTELRNKLSDLSDKDRWLRNDLSKVLGSMKHNLYGGGYDVDELTWNEIFFEIGKLKSQSDYLSLAGHIDSCESRLYCLENKDNPDKIITHQLMNK